MLTGSQTAPTHSHWGCFYTDVLRNGPRQNKLFLCCMGLERNPLHDGRRYTAIFSAEGLSCDFCVPRLLVLAVTTKHISLRVKSTHCPHAGHDDHIKKQHWDLTGRHINNTNPTLIGMDGNSRASPIRTTGQNRSQDVKQSAHRFNHFLAQHDIRRPALDWETIPKTTYVVRGLHTRIGYVAAIAASHGYTTEYDVSHDLVDALAHDDHFPAMVTIQCQSQPRTTGGILNWCEFDLARLEDKATFDKVATQLANLKPIQWA